MGYTINRILCHYQCIWVYGCKRSNMKSEDMIAIGIGIMGVILFGVIIYDYV